MKKIIVTLLVCLFGFSAAENVLGATIFEIPADVMETEFEKDYAVLNRLGVIDVGEEGMFMPYSRVTRAEFAVMLEKLIDPDSVYEGRSFADVSEAHYAAQAISYLSGQGYMTGYENSIFKPEDELRYNEIVKVAVSMLGYDPMIELYGGYPNGYLSVAHEIGILNGVSPDGEFINKGNIIKLLVNLLDAHPIKLGDDAKSYVVDTNTTMLNVICKLYRIDGIVEANSDASISSDSHTTEGMIRIGGEDFYYDGTEDLLGYYVEGYYSVDEEDEYIIEALVPDSGKNTDLRIVAKDIVSADKLYSLEYEAENGNFKRAKYDSNTVFIYNGKNLETVAADDLAIENGYLEWIDNDSNNVADCIKIWEYYNIVVDFANDEKIVDRFDNSKNIETENYEKITVIGTNGEKSTLSEIKTGTVASVYLSKATEDNIVKLVLSDTVVSGKVASTYEVGGVRYVKIEEEDYVIYSGYKTYAGTEIRYGDEGTYLMDADGKIVTMGARTYSGFTLGLLADCRVYEDAGEMIVRLKVYSQNGTLDYLYAKEKFSLDGEVYKTGRFSEAGEVLKAVVGEPIRYKLNAENYLNVVDTSKTGDESNNDQLKPGVSTAISGRYLASTRIIEGKMILDPNVTVFVVPAEFDNVTEDDFRCTGIGYFIGNQTYNNVKSYLLEDKLSADVVVIRGETSIMNHESAVAIVSSESSLALNEDDEAVPRLIVLEDGVEKELLAASADVMNQVYKINRYSRAGDTLELVPGKQIEKGDLIKYSIDGKGYVNKVALIYDASEESIISLNPYHTDFHEQGNRYVMGRIEEKYDGYVKLVYTNTSGVEVVEYHNIGAGKIYRVESKHKVFIEEMAFNELNDQVHNQSADQVVIVSATGVPKATYLYE